MVSTVRPKASDTPTKPMPRPGKAAARTALPQPPSTSQRVPMNSAVKRFDMGIEISLFGQATLVANSRGVEPCRGSRPSHIPATRLPDYRRIDDYAVFSRLATAEQCSVTIRVHIAAADDDAHPLTREVRSSAAGRCKAQTPGRLDDDLQAIGKHTHAVDQLRVGRGENARRIATNDFERDLPQALSLSAVRDGLRYVDAHDGALQQRALTIVTRLRLDAIHVAPRRERLVGQQRA